MASHFLLQRWAHSICFLCVLLSVDSSDFIPTPTLSASGVFISKKRTATSFRLSYNSRNNARFGMKRKTLLTIKSVPTFYSLVPFVRPPRHSGLKLSFSNTYTHGLSIRKTQPCVWWEFFVI